MTDQEWIRAALEAFEGPLILYAQKITNDLERARDVVQETFLRLCRARREAVEAHLAEWLYTVCRNAAVDARRKERPMRPPDDTAGPENEGPVTVLETKEEGARALAYLDRLPEKQREALRLKFQGGLSYREISRVMGESIGNVGYLIHVGLKTLRERLQGGDPAGEVLR